MNTVLAAGLLSILVACSSAPSGPARAPSSSAGGTAPAAAVASVPAVEKKDVAATTTVPLTPDLAALTKAAKAHGYTPRSHNGVIVYCKTAQQVGTRFETTSCISQADVANVVNSAEAQREDVQAMQRKSWIKPIGN
jgi:hypothetical protein